MKETQYFLKQLDDTIRETEMYEIVQELLHSIVLEYPYMKAELCDNEQSYRNFLTRLK